MNQRGNIIFAAVIILLILTGTVCSVYADDRSYSIPWSNVDLVVGDDGSLHVTELIHYHFTGIYNGVSRNIPLKSYESINSIMVNVTGAYYNYTIQNNDNQLNLNVYLFQDQAKTMPIHDRDVDVVYSYDMIHVVNFYDDVAELQYKVWGEDWKVPVGHVNTIVHLKSEDGVKYWLNPPYLSKNSSWDNSNLLVTSTTIPKNNWFEIRMTIPLNQFSSFSKGHMMNGNGSAAIENIQHDYANKVWFEEFLFTILPILILLSLIYPFYIIYQSWGGQFRTRGRSTGDLPENDPPAIVNAICGNGISKQAGDPGIDGFLATIMDLIKRRYITLDHHYDEDEGLKLKINKNRDMKNLKSFEKTALDFLKNFERNNTIYMDKMSDNLEKTHFQKRFLDWRKQVNKKINSSKLNIMFVERNNIGMYVYGFITLLGSILIIAMASNNPMPGAIYSFYAGIILLPVSILSLLMTSRVKVKWTDYGKEYRASWKGYKGYVKNSKHYDDSKVFDNYMIYGTALGVGDNVMKLIGKKFQGEALLNTPLYTLQNSYEYKKFRNTLISYMGAYGAMQVYLYGNDGSGGSGGLGGGGAGGAGGGSGGGGGGAF